MKKRFLSAMLAAALLLTPLSTFSAIKDLKGFDKKVYQGALALYASSPMMGITDRFICTTQVVEKVHGGYKLLSAGHCTPANAELPPDMTFSVAEDLGQPLTPVTLAAAVLNDSEDWSVFYLTTNKKFSVIELGDENDARLNDKTIDVNFSLALAKEVSMGLVSSTVQSSGPMKGFFQVTMFDSHGASGSSVVDERTKKIIGIVIAGVDGSTMPTWVEPISTIKKAIDKASLPRSANGKIDLKIQVGVAKENHF